MSDSTKTLLQSLKDFLTGTLLSRGSGLFREIAMAMTFGISPSVASFWMAFRFAYLFRRLFGEGGLNIAFIPHYEDLKKKDPGVAHTFFLNLSKRLTLILFLIILASEIALGSFLVLIDLSLETRETLSLTMIMLPALLFLSLFALNSALLNSEKSYFLPSFAPTVVNILWIIAAFIIPYFAPQRPIQYLAMVIVFAFAIQWLVTAIPAYSLSLSSSYQKKEPLLPFLKPFLLTIIGVTAQQINGAIDALFAKASDPEGPAILWYALRLQQLPFALIGVGLMNSLLPPLARTNDEKTFQQLLNFSLKKVITFMIPLTAAILVGSLGAVNLLYGRGAFSEKATYETSSCLMVYGLSLLPMSWTLLLATAFYSKKNYKTPTYCSISSIGANILLNALFVYVFHWKSVSIALSTTCASLLNGLFLTFFLTKHTSEFLQGVGKQILKISLISLLSLIVTLIAGAIFTHDNTLRFIAKWPLLPISRTLPQQIFSMGTIAFVFISSLLVLSYLFKIEEILSFMKFRRKQKKVI